MNSYRIHQMMLFNMGIRISLIHKGTGQKAIIQCSMNNTHMNFLTLNLNYSTERVKAHTIHNILAIGYACQLNKRKCNH